MTAWRWSPAFNGSSFGHLLRPVIDHPDKRGVVPSPGEIHQLFELGNESRISDRVEGFGDPGVDFLACAELATQVWVGLGVFAPLVVHVPPSIHRRFEGFAGFLGVEIDQPLSLLLREPEVFEDGVSGSFGFWVKGPTFGDGVVLVLLWCAGLGRLIVGLGFSRRFLRRLRQ